jgi:hypothetical protein
MTKKPVEETPIEMIGGMSKESLKRISDYLETRLGIYGVRSYAFKWEAGLRNPDYVYGEVSIDKQFFGIFSHAMTSCTLNVSVWTGKLVETGVVSINVSVSYEHVGGGSNGHELDIRLQMNVNDNRLWEVD